MKTLPQNSPSSLKFIAGTLGLLCVLSGVRVQAGTNSLYWDINGATTGAGGATPSGSWESAFWSTSSAGTAATAAWQEGDFPRFAAGTDATGSYTVTANANHIIAGMLASTTTGTVTINGTGVLTIDPTGGPQQGFFGGSGFIRISSKLTGAGGVICQSGQIYLDGPNDYSGGTTAGSGLINFNNSSSFGSGNILVSVSGSALIVEGTSALTIPNNWTVSVSPATINCVGNTAGVTYSGNISLGANTLNIGSGGATGNIDIFSGVISGSGGIGRSAAQSPAGIVKFTGANTYTGKTSLQSGLTYATTLNSVSSPAQQASSSFGVPSSAANGTLSIGGTTVGGTLVYVGAGETTDRIVDLAGTSGGATLENDGTGAVVFTSANTASGVGSKTLTLQGTSTAANTISGAIVDNTTTGTTVTTASFLSGATTITLASVDGISVGAAISGTGIPAGDTVKSINTSTKVVTLNTAASGAGTLGETITVPGVINITAVAKAQAGQWVLSGANTYRGGTTVSAGTLSVNSIADSGTSALGTSGTLTLSGGKLSYTGAASATTARAVTLSGTASILDLPAGNLEFSGAAKSGTFTKTGTGTLTLSGSTDNSSLGLNVNGGTVILNKTSTGSVHALGATTTINNGGMLQLSGTGGDQIYQGVNVTVNSGGVFDANGKTEGMTSLTLNGTGSGSGALINSAAATTATLTGTAANGFPLGSAASVGGVGNLTLAGVISGAFPLTKVGTGTLTLNSANTYSGATTVSAGTLVVHAASGLASTSVSVASGASIQFDTTSALGASASLVLDISSSANLNYAGVMPIASLSLDGGATTVTPGSWGAPGSGAVNTDSRLSGSGILNVGVPAPTLTLGSLLNPSTYGAAVTLTATVAGGSGTPTGTVTFADGATVLGSAPLDGTGAATLTLSTLGAATHSLTLFYSGDSTYGAGYSSVLSQVVNKAALSVTANDQTKTYGQTVAFGAGSTLFTSSGLQNGETIGTVTLAVSGNGGAATATVAGSPYTITASAAIGGTFSAANYTITYNTGTLTVTPASLTVAATGLLIYGNDPSNTVYAPSFSGFLNGDTVSVVTGSADYSTDATATDYIGTNYIAHVVDLGTLTAANYTFTAGVDGVTTITNRPLWVTNALASNKVYDATTAATVDFSGAGLTNIVNGDDTNPGAVSLNSSGATGAFSDKNVGTGKTVAISGLALAGDLGTNYVLIQPTTATASITAAPLAVSATGVDKVYDGTTAATVTLAATPLGTDSVTPAYTTAAFASKNAGPNVAISVSGISISGPDAGNYTPNATASTTANIGARTLTVTATGVDKVYDGTMAASVTLADNKVAGDDVTDSYTAASFADKVVAAGKAVSVSGISIGGGDAGNYTLANVTASTTANITARTLTVTATGVDKVYDGGTAATVNLADNKVAGDAVTDAYTSAAFADKAVAAGKAVSVSGISINGADAGNYTLANTTASTTASITARTLTVTATAANKAYDGTATASVTLADNKLAGDDVTDGYTSATFANKNIGTGKTVTVSGISASGADLGNYTLANTTTTATADITAATLTITATGVNKAYDGTTAATVTLADNKVAGDDVTDSYTAATFADKNVATGIAVSVSGLSISGADAGNYTLASTTASTTADITARTLTVSAAGVNKVYDGTTAATVTLSDDKVAGDDVTDSYTSAAFADANVGTGKAVSVSGISISGGAAGNYSLASTTASTTADITGAASSTALASSLNPSTQGSNVTFTATVSSGAGTPAGDVVFLANGVPFSTNTLVAGVAAASTATLAVGTNTISAQYAAQNNWLLSSATLQQVVNSAIVYSQTNAVLGIVANGDGTYTLSLLGTPGASYYVVSTADLTAPVAAWSALTYSTNTAPSPSGQWSVVVSNAAPAFFRTVAVNPAP